MFQDALQNTLSHEGYYANVEGDKGGETYRGIARNFFPEWNGWAIVDAEKAKKGGSLPWNYKITSALLDDYIAVFYKKYFWDKIYLDLVKDSNLQNFIFDFFVNSRNSGVKVIQQTLRNVFNKNIAVDGAMGTQTVNAINSVDGKSLFNALKKARESFYVTISQKGQNAKFLKGWLKRLNSFEYVPVVTMSAILVTGLAVAGFLIFKRHLV